MALATSGTPQEGPLHRHLAGPGMSRLPKGAAFVLFAAGRTAGWLAHALEQQAQDSLIGPQARYVIDPAA